MSINLNYNEFSRLINDREYFNKKDLSVETKLKIEKIHSMIDKMNQTDEIVKNKLKEK